MKRGTLTLMDEVLTPDSSRFWPVESYQEGISPPSYDKQFVRDWLEKVRIDGRPWNKSAPAPKAFTKRYCRNTATRYSEALSNAVSIAHDMTSRASYATWSCKQIRSTSER